MVSKGEELRRAIDEERTPDGTINNCSLAHGEPEESCQMCGGRCPDRKYYLAGERPPRPRRGREGGGAKGEVAVQVEDLTLTVTWGEEVFCPVQFHSFRVGPISISCKVVEGQSMRDVYREMWGELDAMAAEQFTDKLVGCLERIRRAAAEAERKKG